jgi:hypothetical protein
MYSEVIISILDTTVGFMSGHINNVTSIRLSVTIDVPGNSLLAVIVQHAEVIRMTSTTIDQFVQTTVSQKAT